MAPAPSSRTGGTGVGWHTAWGPDGHIYLLDSMGSGPKQITDEEFSASLLLHPTYAVRAPSDLPAQAWTVQCIYRKLFQISNQYSTATYRYGNLFPWQARAARSVQKAFYNISTAFGTASWCLCSAAVLATCLFLLVRRRYWRLPDASCRRRSLKRPGRRMFSYINGKPSSCQAVIL